MARNIGVFYSDCFSFLHETGNKNISYKLGWERRGKKAWNGYVRERENRRLNGLGKYKQTAPQLLDPWVGCGHECKVKLRSMMVYFSPAVFCWVRAGNKWVKSWMQSELHFAKWIGIRKGPFVQSIGKRAIRIRETRISVETEGTWGHEGMRDVEKVVRAMDLGPQWGWRVVKGEVLQEQGPWRRHPHCQPGLWY